MDFQKSKLDLQLERSEDVIDSYFQVKNPQKITFL